MKIKIELTKNKELAASTTNPLNNTRKPKFTDNSVLNQRQKLLDYLKQHGSITTREAREVLDIYQPPARIFELKAEGYLINTVWVTWISDYQIKHRIAKYFLVSLEPVQSANDSEVTI